MLNRKTEHASSQRKGWLLLGLVAGVILASGFYFHLRASSVAAPANEVLRNDPMTAPSMRLDEPLMPIREPTTLDAQKVALGKLLFHDARLSRDGGVSCASCHDLAKGGVDRRARSLGVNGREGEINAPTVYNAAFNFRQFWDGRVGSLEEQVSGPVLNPVEMANTWDRVLATLRADVRMASSFRAIYQSEPTMAAVQDAIAEFERSLVTPSRMDRWLLGDAGALSDEELEGYRLFRRHGCVACHQGENIGGNLFQRFGVMQDYFAGKKATTADLGRYNVTGREEDKYVFKVPSLRNVALTPPYFHDASTDSLDEAVALMGRFQLGVDLSQEDVSSIVLFLHTLTGEKLQ
ncbi:MAG: cytochrome-c peroxidase [Zoogloeaceae bacterium]|jgi:cytochrome c peroxidase|nr:cytochrome-c peroxidase [Zoogloeaceae bacterium]